jgi:hypothetical protein
VVNFRGPMMFLVVFRYHGGAFVVFSKHLNEDLEVAALEGSFASVVGGVPAAAAVFTRDVERMRPYLIDAVEQGIGRTLEREPAGFRP